MQILFAGVCFSLTMGQQFTEVGQELGVADLWSYHNKGGVAWVDYDNDGLLDLYLNCPSFYIMPYIENYSRLYRNTGDGFVDVAPQLGVDVGPGQSWNTAWADYNQDGWMDLFVANGQGVLGSPDVPNQMYRNDGGTFTEVGAELGLGIVDVSYHGVAWGDFNNDGRPDFVVMRYDTYIDDFLYRNEGDHFTEVAVELGLVYSSNFSNRANSTWGDYDNDGDLDLFIPASPHRNLLYRNDLDTEGQFTEVAIELGVADSGAYSMTANWIDFDNDGDLDLFVTNYTILNSPYPVPYPSRLFRNDGETTGHFTDVGFELGVADSIGGFSSRWADYDHDGDLDLFLTVLYSTNRLYRNDWNETGQFTDVSDSLDVDPLSEDYGCAWGDYDNDGDLDLYLSNPRREEHNSYNLLYRNNQDDQNYLKVRFLSAGGGYSRQGSRVMVYRAGTDSLVGLREIEGGSGWQPSQDMYDCHFGLDGTRAYDLVIRSTVRINGENIVLDKTVKPELGGVVPVEIGGFIEVRDTVDVALETGTEKPPLPGSITLYPNYPNPFNPSTTIRYDLAEPSRVTLKVFDMIGREVKTLVNTTQDPGRKFVQWDGTDRYGHTVSAGIYLVRIQANQNTAVRKLILIK